MKNHRIIHIITFIALYVLFSSCAKGIRPGYKPGWSIVRGTISSSGYSRDVAIGDLNNDGAIDILSANFKDGGVDIWLTDEYGEWNYLVQVARIYKVNALTIGDLDGDKLMDIVYAPVERGINVLLNMGDGSWMRSASPTGEGRYSKLIIDDINKDGKMDLVASNIGSELNGGIQVWLGDGKGKWVKETGPDSYHIYRDVVVVDFNNDGSLDIAGAVWGEDSGVKVWWGNGKGGWWAVPENPETKEEDSIWALAAADIDDDGFQDLIASLYYNRGIRVWFGGKKDKWSEGVVPAEYGSFWRIGLTDFNKDGDVDLVASSHVQSGFSTWVGDGRGGWNRVNTGLPAEGSFYGFKLQDLDGDDHIDVVASSYSEGVKLWYGLGYKDIIKPGMKRMTGEKKKGALKVDKTPERASVTKALMEPMRISTGVFFDIASTELNSRAKVVLDRIAVFLKNHPDSEVLLQGHADDRPVVSGRFPSNKVLSERRAEAVKRYLIQATGLKGERWSLEGLGTEFPLAADYEPNRSVEITITMEGVEAAGVKEVVEEAGPPVTPASRRKPGEYIPPTPRVIYEYKVGPEDVLAIGIWERGELKQFEILVKEDGTISFMFLEDIYVWGKTVREIKEIITNRLREYYREPKIEVAVLKYNSQKVKVLGAVTNPGIMTLKRPTTLVELISEAGGYQSNADLKSVVVTRKDGSVHYINLYRALYQGDTSQNIPIKEGDTVIIPTTEEAIMEAYVFRSGRGGAGGGGRGGGVGMQAMAVAIDEETRILDVITEIGGWSADAVPSSTMIIRGDLYNPEIMRVDLTRLTEKGDFSQNVAVRDKDIIFIPTHFISDINYWASQFIPLLTLGTYPFTITRSYQRLFE